MRTIFNNRISNENLPPKPNTEYIYLLDIAWLENPHKEVNIPKGIIVENVEQTANGSYSFNIKERLAGDNTTYVCSYGWAFVENTKENVKLLEILEIERENLKLQQQKVEKLKHELVSLYDFSNYDKNTKTDIKE